MSEEPKQQRSQVSIVKTTFFDVTLAYSSSELYVARQRQSATNTALPKGSVAQYLLHYAAQASQSRVAIVCYHSRFVYTLSPLAVSLFYHKEFR